jgi:WD40 repeat protein
MASNDSAPKCARCGTALPPGSTAGTCPRCALEQALTANTQSESGDTIFLRDIPIPPGPIKQIGDYELLSELARGGMGVVYRARQVSLNRLVAVKMILAGHLAGEHEVKRFHTEAEAVARLEHPNIVPIYEVGEQSGQHYFSMRLIEGESLAVQIAAKKWKPGECQRIARLMAAIARAVHYAHQRGILHRDLKPANVLIDASDEPHITDFGLARQMEGAGGLTISGSILGTPNYMAPEQAAGTVSQLTTAADVYSLGSILYQLLTGAPPFDAPTPFQILQRVTQQEPVLPRILQPKVDRDLETICLKCLEKEPQKRYGSAGALAEDLERWLKGEAILARPVKPLERVWKWSQRHPALALVSGFALLALLGGIAGISLEWRRAETAGKSLRESLVLSRMARAEDRFERRQSAAALAMLAEAHRLDPELHVSAHRLLSALTWRNWPLPLHQIGPLSENINLVRLSRSGQWLVIAGAEAGACWIWSRDQGLVTNSWPKSFYWQDFKYSADETWMLGVAADGQVHVGRTAAGKVDWHTPARTNTTVLAGFGPEGDTVVTAGTDSVQTWSTLTGDLLRTTSYKSEANMVALTADARWVAEAGTNRSVVIWDTTTGQPACAPLVFDAPISKLLFSPRQGELLICAEERNPAIWNWKQGLKVSSLLYTQKVEAAEFDSGGAIAALDGTGGLVVFDASSGNELFRRQDYNLSRTPPVRFSSPKGFGLTANGRNASFISTNGTFLSEPIPSRWVIATADMSADGHLLAMAPAGDTCFIWDLNDGQAHYTHPSQPGGIWSLAFSPDGRFLASGDKDKTALIFDARTWKPAIPPLRHASSVRMARFSPDSRRVATASADSTAMIWSVETGAALTKPMQHAAAVCHVAFDATGRLVATITLTGTLRFWNAADGQPLSEPIDLNKGLSTVYSKEVFSMEFSPDGSRLLVACWNGTAQIWDAHSYRQVSSIGHDSPVSGARFSPDGRRVATVTLGGIAQIWDPETGKSFTKPMADEAELMCVSFSPDGGKLLTAGFEGKVRIRSPLGKLLAETEKAPGDIYAAAFSPSSQFFAAGFTSGRTRVWDAANAAPASEIFEISGQQTRLAISPDDHWLAVSGDSEGPALIPQYLPKDPAPRWLPELVEALAQQKISGIAEEVPVSALLELRHRLANLPGQDFYSRWARWFFADRLQRQPYPEF